MLELRPPSSYILGRSALPELDLYGDGGGAGGNDAAAAGAAGGGNAAAGAGQPPRVSELKRLKKALRAAGLSTKGSKAELHARLNASAR